MRHLVVMLAKLCERSINFCSLADSIDAATLTGRFFSM
ncbi:hypothetical protein ECMP0209401_3146 [Escherichia coli MP020940.1]|nr:hypothetical protein ECMP0209401_3146 [Escherichia coli MP020940.1]EMZ63295.1 hypothetical protein EC174900_2873 [Escherichia coli 174900]EMZ97076.1 hypothetical protein ECP03048161_3126 [Escherichia coli P0304816.1]ENF18539.1 hypothetical protein ECP030481611_2879 [Escherichia coli P0304816.11]ENF29871.1 hypothetical protein ECP030481612_2803 [Escherichia coli P0304816.12]ENF33637.1 hypothetical protein ECP030481614_2902 [Escherichia coli P0304816.14]ENF70820.1 hypothetical protein ECP030